MQVNDLFTAITAQIIADIEAGAGTWRMPWHCLADNGTPVNVHGRPYRGLNAWWLACLGAVDYPSATYGTYQSWKRHGAQVRRGQQGHAVILWKPTTVTTDDTTDTEGTDRSGSSRRLIARTFTVFAAEQVDGADKILAERTETRANRDTPERVAEADRYLVATGLKVIEGGNRAYYSPSDDTIHVPGLHQFDHASMFYGSLCHEACHATGHPDRLARDLTGRFGSNAYAAEELVAELGAAMWSAQMGMSATTRPDHAAYLSSWLDILKTDARALVTVASKAQAAVDYLNVAAGYSPAPIASVAEAA